MVVAHFCGLGSVWLFFFFLPLFTHDSGVVLFLAPSTMVRVASYAANVP